MRKELVPYMYKRVRYSGTVDLMNFYSQHVMVGMLDVRTPDGSVIPHLWLRMKVTDADKLLQGDSITFTAQAYEYEREDKTQSISLCLPDNFTIERKNFSVKEIA